MARDSNPVGLLAPVLCSLIAVLEGYDIQSFGVVAPRLAEDMHLSAGVLGIAASAALVGLVIGAFGGGLLSDRKGPKPVLLWSIVLFGVFSVMTSLSSSLPMLVTARLLTGIGFGGAMPNLLAIATRLRPGGRHIGLTTLIFCGMPAGGAMTTVVVHALGTPLPWRMVFAIGGALPLVLTPAAWAWLPSFPAVKQDASDKDVAAALFGEGRAARTLLLWLSFFCTMLLLFLFLNWLPLLVIGKGFEASLGVNASFAFNICGIVAALVLGAWADRIGMGLPMLAATALMLAGTAVMLTIDTVTPLLASAAAIGGGSIALEYILYAAAPMPYARARIAAAGAAMAVGRLGSITGPLLAGSLRQAGFSVDALLAMLLPVVVLAGVTGILAVRGNGAGKAKIAVSSDGVA